MQKHYFSRTKREITRMDDVTYNSYKDSGEFFYKRHDALYQQVLHEEKIWSVEQAVRLLARLDPNDHEDPCLLMGSSYNNIKKSMDTDQRSGKLPLKENKDINGNVTLVADNFVFIRWAIDKGFNVPEVFVEFMGVMERRHERAEVYSTIHSPKNRENDIFSQESLENLEFGIRVKNNLKKNSEKASLMKKEVSEKKYRPILNSIWEDLNSKNNNKKYSAGQLASNYLKQNKNATVTKTYLQKKISQEPTLQPFLTHRRKK